MQSLGVGILNEIIKLDHAVNDQVNLKYAINKPKKSRNPKIQEKKNEKNLLFKMQKYFLKEDNRLLMLLKVGYLQ